MNLKDIKKNLVICIPSFINWNDYKKELAKVEDGKEVMNFKVAYLPKIMCDKCYLCHRGQILGWMQIVKYIQNAEFVCTTTGNHWPKGNYIQRSGPFHYLKNPVPYSSFRGFRYISDIE